jgi:Skp family chaperone for outer membrane proteins
MTDGLKSSFELAMERLRAREEASAAPLSTGQKETIARIRAEFRAQRAELEVLHRTAVDQAAAREDQDKLRQLADEFERESAALQEREEAAVRGARGD